MVLCSSSPCARRHCNESRPCLSACLVFLTFLFFFFSTPVFLVPMRRGLRRLGVEEAKRHPIYRLVRVESWDPQGSTLGFLLSITLSANLSSLWLLVMGDGEGRRSRLLRHDSGSLRVIVLDSWSQCVDFVCIFSSFNQCNLVISKTLYTHVVLVTVMIAPCISMCPQY